MTYGDGSSTNGNKPLVALDVCGHEITHAVSYTHLDVYKRQVLSSVF